MPSTWDVNFHGASRRPAQQVAAPTPSASSASAQRAAKLPERLGTTDGSPLHATCTCSTLLWPLSLWGLSPRTIASPSHLACCLRTIVARRRCPRLSKCDVLAVRHSFLRFFVSGYAQFRRFVPDSRLRWDSERDSGLLDSIHVPWQTFLLHSWLGKAAGTARCRSTL